MYSLPACCLEGKYRHTHAHKQHGMRSGTTHETHAQACMLIGDQARHTPPEYGAPAHEDQERERTMTAITSSGCARPSPS